jgi:tetratricopeptide (TPR) repeat protein/CHAT domain-containing protein
MAICYGRQQQYARAEFLSRKALQIYEEVFGGNHPEVALLSSNLAHVQARSGDLAGARASYRRSADIYRAAHGDKSQEYLAALGELAGVTRDLAARHEREDNDGAAQAERREVWQLQQQIHGDGHWEVTDARLALERVERVAAMDKAMRERSRRAERDLSEASRRHEEQRPAEALPIAERVLRELGEVWGAASLEAGRAALLVGDVSFDLQRYEPARAAYDRAVQIFRSVLGEQHRDVGLALNNLGAAAERLGDLPAAIAAYRQACQVYERSLEPKHPRPFTSLRNLADACVKRGSQQFEQGEYEAAGQAWEEVIATRIKLLGELHWQVTDARLHRSYALLVAGLGTADQSRLREAETRQQQAAKLLDDGQFRTAREAAEQALATRREILVPDHWRVADVLVLLGDLDDLVWDVEAARRHYQEAAAIREKTLGADHPATAESLYTLGMLQASLGENEPAQQLLERALGIQTRVLGERDAATAASRAAIERLRTASRGEHAAPLSRARERFAQRFLEESDRASQLVKQGRRDETLAAAEKSLVLVQAVFGPTSDLARLQRTNVALAYLECGRFAESERLYREVLQSQPKTPPADDWQLVETRASLALATRLKSLDEAGRQQWSQSAQWIGEADRLAAQGPGAQAVPLLERALEVRRELCQDDPLAIANCLSRLAVLRLNAEDYARARQDAESAVASYRQALGPLNPLLAGSLTNLGHACQGLGRNDEARRYFEQALQIYRQARGPEHADTVQAMISLGSACRGGGDHASACRHLEEALPLAQRVHGPEHRVVARIQRDLANALDQLGDRVAARQHLERAVAIYRQVAKGPDADTATALQNLGDLLSRTSQYATAVQYQQEALAIRERVLGPKHPFTLASLFGLGCTAFLQGNLEEAERQIRECAELLKQTQGEQSADCRAARGMLATVYQSQAQRRLDAEDFAAARQAVQQALSVRAEVLGEPESATAELRLLLADVEFLEKATPDQRRRLKEAAEQLQQAESCAGEKSFAEAIPLAQRAFDTRREILTADHRRTAEAAISLASYHFQAGDPLAAEPLCRQAADAYRKTLGEQHQEYFASLTLVAQILVELGRHREAETLFERALDIVGKTQKPQDAKYQVVAGFLVNLYLKQTAASEDRGDFLEATGLLERAFQLRLRMLGPEHWDVATVRWQRDRARQFAALPDESRRGLIAADQQLQQARQRVAQGKPAEALAPARQALQTQETVLGGEHPELIGTLQQLARCHRDLGQANEAQKYAERALELSRQAVGEVHPQTAELHGLLGLIHMEQKAYAAARQSHRRALDIYQRIAPDSGEVAIALNNLAWALQELGETTTARGYYEQSLAIRKRVHGPEHPRTAHVLMNLGGLLDEMQETTASRGCFEQALAIYRRTYGEQHPDTATAYKALASWCGRHGQKAQAQSYYEQALAILTQVVGEDHVLTARCRQQVGRLLLDREDYAAARHQLEQALASFRRTTGPESLDTAACLSSLGRWAWRTGDLAAARTQWEESLAIFRKCRGPGDPLIADGLLELAPLYSTMGDQAAARAMYEQALGIQRQAWGPQHHRTAKTLATLGGRYQEMGYYEEVRRFLDEALQIFRNTPGKEADVSDTLQKLGRLHLALDDHAEARRCLEESLASDRKRLGPKHSDLATALHNVGAVLECMGSNAAARLYLEESLAMKTELVGPDDPSLCVTLNSLGALVKQTDPAAGLRYYERELAIKLRQLQQQSPPTAAALEEVADQLKKLDRRAEALPYYQQALQTVRGKLGQEHPQTASLLEAIATCQTSGQAALPYLQQALQVMRGARGDHSAATAYYQKELAHRLLALNQREEAQRQFDAALAVYEKVYGPSHPKTLNMLADVAGAMAVKDYDVARSYFDRLLAFREQALGPDHPDTAETHLQIADALIRRQRIEEAWSPLIRGLRAVTAQRTRYLARSAEDEQRWLADYRRHLFEAVLSVAEALPELGDERADQVLELLLDWKSGGGQLLRARQEALVCEQDATATRLTTELHAARQRLVALQLQGSRLGGDTAYRQQLDTLRRQHDELERQVAERVRDYAVLRQGFQAGPVTIAQQLEPESVLVEFVKYRRYLPARTAASEDWGPPRYAALLLWPQPPGGWTADFAQAETLSRRSGRPLMLLFHAPWAAPAVKMRQEVLALPEVLDTIRQKCLPVQVDQQKQGELAQRFGVTALPCLVVVSSDGKVLDRKSGALAKDEFLRWLDAVPSGVRHPRFVSLGDAAPIEAAIRDWRRAVPGGALTAELEQRLQAALWQPLAQALPNYVRRLHVAPDGELSLVPLEAVRLADGRYLIEQYEVSYLANGRDRMPRLKRPGRAGLAVVVSNPDYDSGAASAQPVPAAGPSPAPVQLAQRLRSTDSALRDIRFATLPGFTGEASAVVRTWREVRPNERVEELQGAEASEERLAAVQHPRVLHLITHGFFLPDLSPRASLSLGSAPSLPIPTAASQPEGRGLEPLDTPPDAAPTSLGEDPRLRSGVALAGANRWEQRSMQGQSDGLLTALEVQQIDLWGTELVVLSACETGLGEVQVGEGVLGLRRAFQLAGAETVLASLWKVPDAETQRLMVRFFELWLAGQSKSAALRTAQLELIGQLRQASGPRNTAPPLYWAGFICHGQP